MKDFFKFTLATVTGIILSSIVLHRHHGDFRNRFIIRYGNSRQEKLSDDARS